MKKYLSLLLIALLLTSCSGTPESENAAGNAALEEPAPAASEETVGEESADQVIEKPDIEHYITVDAAGTPVYENGDLIIPLDKSVHYSLDDAVSVGMILDAAAESIGGKIVSDQYPELLGEDNTYTGVAIRPAETLPDGDCLFSITFGNYLVSFELTIG